MQGIEVCKSCLCAIFLSALLAIPVLGQTATISGRVTDSGGAVIVGATVELTSIERGTCFPLSQRTGLAFTCFRVFCQNRIVSCRETRASNKQRCRICW